ncbi:hypothetical protein [Actinomadura livida]|uniref:DUF4149 domain-containing protein n=1 Tax=Actinomadura livida TaxID=79909 RepID=A0A7W7I903_9ACTN|nr:MULTISPECIES: hypothetical protein [Actinomadura]MBB4772634.1 hypothetical protein [Actinomadura catellatispora]GGU11764.1 hypothetical protein GCM10010208_40470 [Actinomadura livida]
MGAHAHGWWILLHLVLFVFWLGGDLGVFYSSRFVLKPDLTPAARTTALSVMSGLDLGPKICLVLFLPSGVTLMALDPHGAELFGMAVFGWWQVVLVWVLALAWLAATIADHRTHGRFPWVRRADWAVRIGLIAALAALSAYTLLADRPFGVTTDPRWLGGKVALYTAAIACGLGIRLTLRPFGPAFGALMSGGSTPEVERTLKRAVDGCLPYVFGIWASVLGAAVLGVLKPGADL